MVADFGADMQRCRTLSMLLGDIFSILFVTGVKITHGIGDLPLPTAGESLGTFTIPSIYMMLDVPGKSLNPKTAFHNANTAQRRS